MGTNQSDLPSRNRAWTKGRLGEEIVDRWLIARGFVPYRPMPGVAHPFDRLCASRSKKTIFVAESKSKPARYAYPDTGINLSNYRDYQLIREKYNLTVFLFFVDEEKSEIYGGKLHKLARPTEIKHNGRILQYPWIQAGIIYFPLDNMRFIAKLTSEQANQLGALRQTSWREDSHGPTHS